MIPPLIERGAFVRRAVASVVLRHNRVAVKESVNVTVVKTGLRFLKSTSKEVRVLPREFPYSPGSLV
jgi:hypothetical protein